MHPDNGDPEGESAACPYETTVSVPQEDAASIYDAVHSAWALDGRPTPGATKFEFEIDQRDMGLKEPPRPEQVFDFSVLDEVTKR